MNSKREACRVSGPSLCLFNYMTENIYNQVIYTKSILLLFLNFRNNFVYFAIT